MKEAIEDAYRQVSDSGTVIVRFFFNARGSLLEKTPLGLFRSLLHQLLMQIRPLLSEFLPKFQKKRDTQSAWEWGLEELQDFFHSAVTQPQGSPIVVFIDAIDECDEEAARAIVSFIESCAESAVSSGAALNVCLSSRHYPNIRLQNCLEITLEYENEADISAYVRAKLLPMSPSDPSDPSSEFVKEIGRRSSGVFLWVVLVVQQLVKASDDGRTLREMREILERVPGRLEEIFRQYFETIENTDRPKTLQIMQWILLAERPLTPTELRFALAFDIEYHSQQECKGSDGFVKHDEQMEKQVRSLSRGLIEVKLLEQDGARTSIVQFIHESVRDFLKEGEGLQILNHPAGRTGEGEGHGILTRSCINYIRSKELRRIPLLEQSRSWEDISASYPFLDYAVSSVFKHARGAEEGERPQANLVQLFQQPTDDVFNCWRYLYDLRLGHSSRLHQGTNATLLHVASEHNLLSCVAILIESGVDVNAEGGRYKTALIAAAVGKYDGVTRMLLENGANVYLYGEEYENLLQVSEFHRILMTEAITDYNHGLLQKVREFLWPLLANASALTDARHVWRRRK